MTIWLDAHLSPLLAAWIEDEFDCTCKTFRSLGFARSADRVVFLAARMAGSVILSKDSDFCDLQRLLGPPPKIIWLRCRNRSNDQMKEFLFQTLGDAITLLKSDDLVEIRDLQ